MSGMLGSQLRYKSKFYLITEEENYEETLDFKEVFDEFRQAFQIVVPGKSYRDFSVGGVMFYMPPNEIAKLGVILPMTPDDLQYDKGGTHTLQSIKIFSEHAGGFIIYYARRIDYEDTPIIASHLTEDVVVGQKTLQVEDPEGFEEGMKVRIFEGANGVVTSGEYGLVENVGVKTLTVSTLKNAYSVGACILMVKNDV